MQSLKEKETLELYRKRNVQMLISKFLSGEIKKIEPVYDPKVGYRYPVVEAIIGEASQVEPFLNKLHKAGVLAKKLHDKLLLCPECSSADISTRYCCPFCKSLDIQKSSLVEHVKCGYMDLEANFQIGDKYVCPKCHEELSKIDIDYRKAGIWCVCNNCGKSFDVAVPSHFCRSCMANSTFEEIVMKDVYSYTLKKDVSTESALNWFLVAAIREFLMQEGLNVESPSMLKGKSGANHTFDIVAYKEDKSRNVIVVDLAMSAGSVVSEQPIIALFAKIFDVSPEKAFLIAMPKLSENGKKMAGLYKISAIEAENQEQALEAMKESLING
jgi:hypothetical protein